MSRQPWWTRGAQIGWVPIGICLSAVTLFFLGNYAIREWQHSAAMLAQRRADAAADLLVMAITRDMRGMQTSVLRSLRFDASGDDLALDINGVGSAFARYPYPEVLFATRDVSATDTMTFYSRSERSPAWLPSTENSTRFPVRGGTAPVISRMLITRIARDVSSGRRFTAFNVKLHGKDYQVMALSYVDPARQTLQAFVGFMVDLRWVRDRYFEELTTQVVRIQNASDGGLNLAVVDGHGVAVVGTLPTATNDSPSSSRRFSLLFFDPALVALDPPADLSHELWTARATISADSALLAAQLGGQQALALAGLSAFVLVVGSILTVRAARGNAKLMAMRSDFVSAVTHELKTPIATIRAVSETVASGRSDDPKLAREYAQLAVHETKRLTRLIDNLLAYARITDVTEAYSFEALDVDALTRETLKEFQSQLSTSDFVVCADIAENLPLVRGDRASMVMALGNIVDNAIRYSNETRRLNVAAQAVNGAVAIGISDAGRGIPADEIEQVTRKFYRGQHTVSGGSGLGLSIAQRIVSDHAGTLSIKSRVGVGTTVTITLPQAD